MFNQCVVAVFANKDAAHQAINLLDQSPFPSDQVSLIANNVRSELPPEDLAAIQSGDKSEEDAIKGAGWGGLLGLLLSVPTLFIPGIGPVLVAGPLAATITGAMVGGFMGGLVGWGVHEDHIEQYQSLIGEGKALIIAHGTPVEVAVAEEHLRTTDCQQIDLHAIDSSDSPEITQSRN